MVKHVYSAFALSYKQLLIDFACSWGSFIKIHEKRK